MQLKKLPSKTRHISISVAQKMETFNFIQTLPKDSIKVIGSRYSGNPYKEYAMMFTGAYAGKYPNKLYKPLLGKLYPNSYLYHVWDHTFHQWGEPLKINKAGLKFYLYSPRTENIDQILNDLKHTMPENLDFNTNQIFFNQENTNSVHIVEIIEKEDSNSELNSNQTDK
ncbi:MAG: hypothetical protein HQ541_02415 [Mariniphaga sp.]|nr:hypothetical protein [Mariniphaga sp.]